MRSLKQHAAGVAFLLLALTPCWSATPKEEVAPDQIIVRYRSAESAALPAGSLRSMAQGLGAPPATLQQLHGRYKLKELRGLAGSQGTPVIAAALQSRLTRRRARAPAGSAVKAAPLREALDRTFLLRFEPGTSVEDLVNAYRLDPNVEAVFPNLLYHYKFVPNDPYFSSSGSWGQPYRDLWGLEKIQASQAWDLSTGEGVVVAVLDSGVDYTHPDLQANIWTNPNPGFNGINDLHGYNAVDNNGDPMDVNGHGTHVAGTIAATGNNATGIVGVAYNAKIMPVRAGYANGSLDTFAIVNGIRYAADHGADVINCSFGGEGASSVMHDAFAYAYAQGAVIVAAAGNETTDTILIVPANYPEVITVAASTPDDVDADFSNYGYKLDLSAPGGGSGNACTNTSGINILSLRAGSLDMYGSEICPSGPLAGKMVVGTGYYRARGTSMATPHVSGVAALLLSHSPHMTNEQVRDVLRKSADDIRDPGFDIFSGDGRLNAFRALQAVQTDLLPTPDVTRLENVVFSLQGTLMFVYGSPYTGFRWEFESLNGSAGAARPPEGSPARAATRLATTSTPQVSLAELGLTAGPYRVRVQAFNGAQTSLWSAPASVNLVEDDLSSARVFPNPWRASRGDGDITFDALPANSTVKIFTIAGRWVKTLNAPAGRATWDRTNNSGDSVASGFYLYIADDGHGHTLRGKLGIIR